MCALQGASSAALAQASAKSRLLVSTSLPPHAFLIERVGGNLVDVQTLVSPGQSPHSFEPTPRQVMRLSESRVYFRAGVPFEQRLVDKIRAAAPQIDFVDLRAGIKMRDMSADEIAAHEHAGHGTLEEHPGHPEPEEPHGPGQPAQREQSSGAQQSPPETRNPAGAPPATNPPDQTGSGLSAAELDARDPHTWLDPKNARIQAETICRALCKLDAAHADVYQKNLAALQADLDRLDAHLREVLAPLRGQPLYVFHPAFGYFVDAYGLRQVPVEINGKEPSIKQLDGLIQRARREHVRIIFVQPQFPSRSAEAVAHAIDGAVVPLDDLAHDYIHNLEGMAETIRRELSR